VPHSRQVAIANAAHSEVEIARFSFIDSHRTLGAHVPVYREPGNKRRDWEIEGDKEEGEGEEGECDLLWNGPLLNVLGDDLLLLLLWLLMRNRRLVVLGIDVGESGILGRLSVLHRLVGLGRHCHSLGHGDLQAERREAQGQRWIQHR
jgi:hypothetical protein